MPRPSDEEVRDAVKEDPSDRHLAPPPVLKLTVGSGGLLTITECISDAFVGGVGSPSTQWA